MTKKELIQKLQNVPDDHDLTFALFEENKKKAGLFHFRLLNPTAQIDKDPDDVISLVASPFKADSAAELSKL